MAFLNELIVALVTGAITSLIIATVNRVRTRRRERAVFRAFPIAGQYLTVYEDTHDGRTQRVKEFLTLEQKGTHVEGMSEGVEDRRVFVFKAEIILESKFLTGAYYDESPARSGIGTYFLQPAGPDAFEGVWAGYGSDQREVVSGRYWWRRMAEDVTVRLLTPDDADLLPKAVAILGEGLGARYVSQEDLEAKLLSPNGAQAVFGAFADEDLIGVATTDHVDPSLSSYISRRATECGAVPPAFDFHETGLVQSSAVEREWRRKGVGTQLLNAQMQHLSDSGSTAALAISWISEEADSSTGMLQSAGFEERCEIPDFWLEDSVRQGYSCPKCGSPCRCTGTVFFRPL